MKGFVVLLALFVGTVAFSQSKGINLQNALVVGQMDKPQERYSIEGAFTELLNRNGVKAIPSLNFSKFGEDATMLASDSIQNLLKEKGIDTYVIVAVRGYDRRFKPSERRDSLALKLEQANLYELYRADIVSVTFEYTFYRNGEFIGNDVIKCGNVSDRESVLKRFTKKTSRRLIKKWR